MGRLILASTLVFIGASIPFAFILWIFLPLFSGDGHVRFSPLPDFLTMVNNKQVTTLSLWEPEFVLSAWDSKGKPVIAARAALVYDLTTNRVLFEKDAKVRLPMASLSKIMTAIIASENKRPDDKYVVTSSALVGENSMGLTAGETLTLEELLYGLILPSGNDAAETLAWNYPLGRDGFVQAMNDKAKALGLTNTQFTNPSGLAGDGEQYATVEDLVVITRYALDNFPLFNTVVQTFLYTIPASSLHKAFYLENETNLLTSYPGVKGVKTGFTDEAGLCLVTYLDYKGHKIIGVLLGSNNRRQEMKDLLDYSLKIQGVTPPLHN